MRTKRAKAALLQLVDAAIRRQLDIDPSRYYLLVRDIVATGSLPTAVNADSSSGFCRPAAHSAAVSHYVTSRICWMISALTRSATACEPK